MPTARRHIVREVGRASNIANNLWLNYVYFNLNLPGRNHSIVLAHTRAGPVQNC